MRQRKDIVIVVLIALVIGLSASLAIVYSANLRGNPTTSTTSSNSNGEVVNGTFAVQAFGYKDYEISSPSSGSTFQISGSYTDNDFTAPVESCIMNASTFQNYWRTEGPVSNGSAVATESVLVSSFSAKIRISITNQGAYAETAEVGIDKVPNVFSISPASNAANLGPNQTATLSFEATALAVSSPANSTLTFVVQNSSGEVLETISLNITVLPLSSCYYSNTSPVGRVGSTLITGQKYDLLFFNPNEQTEEISADISLLS